VDRALGTFTVAEALRAAGCTVEVHDRHFAQDARDAQWLPEVGRRGWVVLTKDRHIRTRQSELIALLGAGVAAFVLTAADLSGPEMARAFQRAVPRMRRILVGQPRPFVARVSPDGAVDLLVRGMPRWLRRELRRMGRSPKG
jgi:predicted nuclease of predicted toxin-antitoxin system